MFLRLQKYIHGIPEMVVYNYTKFADRTVVSQRTTQVEQTGRQEGWQWEVCVGVAVAV